MNLDPITLEDSTNVCSKGSQFTGFEQTFSDKNSVFCRNDVRKKERGAVYFGNLEFFFVYF